ncbi:MAG: GNAT family N-acetyltransferase [Oscillospiraceae bacterium]|nr:GNAT family N-acetyltransferase [Oscillospiraceae bacterium]
MEFIKATAEHIDTILEIAAQATAQLKRLGVDQWQRGYPNRSSWENDIEKGAAWLAVEDGKILGSMSFITEPEEAYAKIEGAWLAEVPYASLHRVCVADHSKGRGVAGKLFLHGIDMAKEQGLKSVRIDTHRDNGPMNRAISKAGFTYCGVIHLIGGEEDGNERVAFEMLL